MIAGLLSNLIGHFGTVWDFDKERKHDTNRGSISVAELFGEEKQNNFKELSLVRKSKSHWISLD